MSEDKMVEEMVNGADETAKRKAEQLIRKIQSSAKQARKKTFLLMVRRTLLWTLAGLLLILLMLCGQIAVWLASVCTCVCVVAAAINVDRFFRW